MELIFILMSTAVGTVVGSIAGVFTAQRINRSPSTEAGPLKQQLRSTEAFLTEAKANVEDLRKQLGERDGKLRANEQELAQMRERLEQVEAEARRQAASAPAGEDVALRAAALEEQRSALEARLADERNRIAEEAGRQIAAIEAQVEAERRRSATLSEQVAALGADLATRPQENELTTERQRVQELSRNVAALMAELADRDSRGSRHATELGDALADERQRVQELTAQVAALSAGAQEPGAPAPELEAERQRGEELAARISALEQELAEEREKARAFSELEAGERAALDAELAAAREHGQELAARITHLDGEFAAERQKVRELTEQAAALTAAAADRAAFDSELAVRRQQEERLAQELAAERRRAGELADRLEGILAEATESAQQRDQALAELGEERERAADLRIQVAELEARMVQMDSQLQDERQSAAKGMALLTVAQDNLARVFKALAIEVPNGNGHDGQNGNALSALEAAAGLAAPAEQAPDKQQPAVPVA